MFKPSNTRPNKISQPSHAASVNELSSEAMDDINSISAGEFSTIQPSIKKRGAKPSALNEWDSLPPLEDHRRPINHQRESLGDLSHNSMGSYKVSQSSNFDSDEIEIDSVLSFDDDTVESFNKGALSRQRNLDDDDSQIVDIDLEMGLSSEPQEKSMDRYQEQALNNVKPRTNQNQDLNSAMLGDNDPNGFINDLPPFSAIDNTDRGQGGFQHQAYNANQAPFNNNFADNTAPINRDFQAQNLEQEAMNNPHLPFNNEADFAVVPNFDHKAPQHNMADNMLPPFINQREQAMPFAYEQQAYDKRLGSGRVNQDPMDQNYFNGQMNRNGQGQFNNAPQEAQDPFSDPAFLAAQTAKPSFYQEQGHKKPYHHHNKTQVGYVSPGVHPFNTNEPNPALEESFVFDKEDVERRTREIWGNRNNLEAYRDHKPQPTIGSTQALANANNMTVQQAMNAQQAMMGSAQNQAMANNMTVQQAMNAQQAMMGSAQNQAQAQAMGAKQSHGAMPYANSNNVAAQAPLDPNGQDSEPPLRLLNPDAPSTLINGYFYDLQNKTQAEVRSGLDRIIQKTSQEMIANQEARAHSHDGSILASDMFKGSRYEHNISEFNRKHQVNTKISGLVASYNAAKNKQAQNNAHKAAPVVVQHSNNNGDVSTVISQGSNNVAQKTPDASRQVPQSAFAGRGSKNYNTIMSDSHNRIVSTDNYGRNAHGGQKKDSNSNIDFSFGSNQAAPREPSSVTANAHTQITKFDTGNIIQAEAVSSTTVSKSNTATVSPTVNIDSILMPASGHVDTHPKSEAPSKEHKTTNVDLSSFNFDLDKDVASLGSSSVTQLATSVDHSAKDKSDSVKNLREEIKQASLELDSLLPDLDDDLQDNSKMPRCKLFDAPDLFESSQSNVKEDNGPIKIKPDFYTTSNDKPAIVDINPLETNNEISTKVDHKNLDMELPELKDDKNLHTFESLSGLKDLGLALRSLADSLQPHQEEESVDFNPLSAPVTPEPKFKVSQDDSNNKTIDAFSSLMASADERFGKGNQKDQDKDNQNKAQDTVALVSIEPNTSSAKATAQGPAQGPALGQAPAQATAQAPAQAQAMAQTQAQAQAQAPAPNQGAPVQGQAAQGQAMSQGQAMAEPQVQAAFAQSTAQGQFMGQEPTNPQEQNFASLGFNGMAMGQNSMLSSYLMRAKSQVSQCPYLPHSGLDGATIERFNLGFDGFYRVEDPNINANYMANTFNWQALIVPLNEDSFVAYNSNTILQNPTGEPERRYVGQGQCFNLALLNGTPINQPLFICANELDALALESLGCKALALGIPYNVMTVLSCLQNLCSTKDIKDILMSQCYLCLPGNNQVWQQAKEALISAFQTLQLSINDVDLTCSCPSIHQALVFNKTALLGKLVAIQESNQAALEAKAALNIAPSTLTNTSGLVLSLESLAKLELTNTLYALSSSSISLSRLVLASLIENKFSSLVYVGSNMQLQMLGSLLSTQQGLTPIENTPLVQLAGYKAKFLPMPWEMNLTKIDEAIRAGLQAQAMLGQTGAPFMIDTFGYDQSLCTSLAPRFAQLAMEFKTPFVVWCTQEQKNIFSGNAFQSIEMAQGSPNEIIFRTIDNACRLHMFSTGK